MTQLTVTASQYSVTSLANSVLKMTLHHLIIPDPLESGPLFYANRNEAFPKELAQ